MSKQSSAVVFLIALFLCISTPSEAKVFFSDGFEYNSQSAFEAVWQSGCPGQSSLMGPSTEFSVSPSHSLRSVQNGGDPSCHIDRPYPDTTHVFFRWYMRLAPGYDLEKPCLPTGSCPGAGGGSKLIYAKALGAGYLVYFFLEPNTHEIHISVPHGGYSVTCPSGPNMPQGPQPNEECVFEPNKAHIAIVPGNTYCIETELVRSSPGKADGVGRIWINGTLTTEYTNIAMARSDEGNTAFDYISYYAQGGYGTRYIDDLAVGDTRIGCSATANLAAPTGLTVH